MTRAIGLRLTAALLLCVLVVPLGGWSNGPDGGDGFGAHDWVLYRADQLARQAGYDWLQWRVAQPRTDDPDTVLHDFRHHVYDVWDDPYGDAPTRVQALYDETVSQLRAHDATAASATFGLLSHYYADACNPLHTDQSAEEERMHGRYETASQRHVDQPDENAGWVVPDGIARRRDAAQETRDAAATAHAAYARLVARYPAHGMDAEVTEITRVSLDRAANGLADLMASAAMDAGIATVAPPARRPALVTAAATPAPPLLPLLAAVLALALGAVVTVTLMRLRTSRR